MELELNLLEKDMNYPYARHHWAKRLAYIMSLSSHVHGNIASAELYPRARRGLEKLS